MLPTHQGSFRLFRFAGITVYLHWSWFIVAIIGYQYRQQYYPSLFWFLLEYISLFGIVLMHEFGHSLACRQVGGKADQIVLWPLGGVAYVAPPPRPGATLWSIAAGPLVNVLLFPLLSGLWFLSGKVSPGNVQELLGMIWWINVGLLVFNILPIYPLDGGQILRSLLWFVVGRARSLQVATVIGFAGAAGIIALAIWIRSVWFGVLAAFMVMNCWRGWQHAQALLRLAKLPRHDAFSCPSCKTAPPREALWLCASCRQPFDIFAFQGNCPFCSARYAVAACPECGKQFTLSEWGVNLQPQL